MSNSKYLDSESLDKINNSIEIVKKIRNDIYKNYKIDILDNDSISLASFYNIIKKVDSNYNCNFSRNGEDGHTIIDGVTVKIESKCSKVAKKKNGSYGKTNFAFHAKGLIKHQAYIFSVWSKDDLEPLRCYYVKDVKNVAKINERLQKLSDEWSKKPATKAGYDVIRIEEDMLLKMLQTSSNIIDKDKVCLL
jgi:hypothetical protein